MLNSATVLVASLRLASLTMGEGRDCFWPDHSPADNFTECNAGAAQSACCRDSDACLSNGYCLQQAGFANRIVRGACTDSTFSNPGCPSACTSVQPNTAVSFFPANVSPNPGGNGLFCCVGSYNGTSKRCDWPSDDNGTRDPFSLPVGSVIVDRNDGRVLASNTTADSSSAVMVTVTAESKSGPSVTAVGVGVGVSLGVLLVAALIGCAVLYSQLRKAKRQIFAQNEPSSHYDERKHDQVFSSTSGLQTPHSDGVTKGYNYPAHQQQQQSGRIESPFSNVIAEAPTDREIAMADSRVVS